MKKAGFKILYVLTAIVVIINTAIGVKKSLFTDIADLPKGELSYSVTAPSGEKTMNIYVVKNNVGSGVRGEIVKDNTCYNIFWQTGIDTVDATWANEDYVVINDIPIEADSTFGYDCRRGISLFDEGSLEFNFINPDGEQTDE